MPLHTTHYNRSLKLDQIRLRLDSHKADQVPIGEMPHLKRWLAIGALLAAVGSAMAKGAGSSGGGYHSSGYRSSTVSLAVLPLHRIS